ncbi:MAG: maleylpyruvate isomerase N-terminal domain-containing protein [Leucobacter sp.]
MPTPDVSGTANLAEEIAAFSAAAAWAADLVESIPAAAWDGPGLGGWDLRSLVGHTSRALLTVEQYLAVPAEIEEVDSAEGYYEMASRGTGADPASVLQRGIDAGSALGADPAAAFREIAGRVVGLLGDERERLISTIAGGIRLSSYLPTRTFELVVHGLDISRAAGLASPAPEAPLRRSIDLAVSLAARAGAGSRLLLALTGRDALGPGFSVLG